uniref:Uncharacterized protein n=1 Tax=Chromera velia CCMP2878 TaxID=1169474 RepID=A0A0G4FCL3_9ALVE|eukprot:Cvel_16361.t1-p1 / transcript=Cvel_16361.t1 / gene=Cvel_16361 / organism=Chromera_velia_CCMP2878 / gene_product=hypothetical protein / transcript_product=hypothetical protein / location=Cvel_scaffold1257:788-6220(+) / protein_length=1093 / sequence_SO=supercontig / SO=protein_coding / is_pseudo=false
MQAVVQGVLGLFRGASTGNQAQSPGTHPGFKRRRQGDGTDPDEDEMENKQIREDALCAFLQHLELKSQTLVDLASNRDSLGLAWLCTFLVTKMAVPVPLHSLDLSKRLEVPPEKAFLFLNALPLSVEELTLGPHLVGGPALPLLCRFLKRVAAARRREGTEVQLKSFVFSGNPLGQVEAPRVVPLMLKGVEKLSLKGNVLVKAAIKALADGIRTGKAESLRTLNLEETGLQKEDLQTLCEAILKRPLKVESLNLSGNPSLGDQGVETLSRVLSIAHMASLSELRLRESGVGNEGLRLLAEVMTQAEVPCLETLDLGGNPFDNEGAVTMVGALQVECLPLLKNLNLIPRDLPFTDQTISTLFKALSAEECPPLEHVRLALQFWNCENSNMAEGGREWGEVEKEENVRLLGAGKVPSIRTVGVGIEGKLVSAFFEEIANAPESPPMLSTGLVLLRPDQEGIDRMGGATEMNRLESLRSLVLIPRTGATSASVVFAPSMSPFLSALSGAAARLPNLCLLGLPRMGLRDEDLVLLGDAMRAGSLCGLRELQLQGNDGVNERGSLALMSALEEGENSAPLLECLQINGTRLGMEGSRLGTALAAGKLKNLSTLRIGSSHWPTSGMFALAKSVRDGFLTGLKTLDLDDTESGVSVIGREGWADFFRSLTESAKGLPVLEMLDLSGTCAGLEGEGLAATFEQGAVPGLRGVYLKQARFSNQGAKALADVVGRGRLPSGLCELYVGGGFGGGMEGGEDFQKLFVEICQKGLPGRPFPALDFSGRVVRRGLNTLGLGLEAGWAGLRNLSVIVLRNTGIQSLHVFSRSVKKGALRNVAHLDLGENLGIPSFVPLMNAIAECVPGGCAKLATLELSGSRAGVGGKAVARALGSGNLPSLRYVTLAPCCFDTEGMAALGEVFREGRAPPRLRQIPLPHNPFDWEMPNWEGDFPDFDSLLDGIARSEVGIPSVSSIDLSGGLIGPTGMRALGVILGSGKVPELRSVALCRCVIDDEDMRAFAEAFRSRSSPSLENLELSENSMTVEGVRAFLNCVRPKSFPRLLRLRLGGQRQMNAEGSAEVRALVETAKSRGKFPSLSLANLLSV